MAAFVTGTSGAGVEGRWTLNRVLVFLGWAAFAVHMIYLAQAEPEWIAIAIFFGPPTVALAALVIRPRPWLELTTAILVAYPAVLSLLLFGGFAALVDPLKGADHRDAVLNLMSILFAAPAGALAFARARRGVPDAGVVAGLRQPFGLATLAVGGLLLGTLLTGMLVADAASESRSGSYDFTPPASVAVTLAGSEFVPAQVAVAPGVLTEIVVENRDTAFHTLTYEKDGTRYDHDVPGSGSARFLVLFEDVGAVEFWCVPHAQATPDGHEGMVGAFVVG